MIKRICTICILFVLIFKTEAQTTVITHGFAALASDPVNGWMLDMANGICARAGSGTIRVYNKASGDFDYKSGSGARTVLLFDWWEDSNDLNKGFSEAAGAALFSALMNGYINEVFNLDDLHFIGHSRGCIVNSEAVERLLVLGFPVEQTSSIDAHDWGGVGIVITDYDVNPDSINSGVEGWAGINWADSYWQDALFSTNGRAVDGTYAVYKGTISHSGIREYYLETILDSTILEGYYYSTLGGGSANRPPRTGIQRNPFFTFSNDGIINGDFERSGGSLYKKIAGWWYHGGSGNGLIDNAYMTLQSGKSSKTHDRFYIPPAAASIKFNYKIEQKDSDGMIPNIDKLRIKLNDTIVLDNVWMDAEMDDWAELTIDLAGKQNSVKTMTFELIDEFGDVNDINSKVSIENVRFDMINVSDNAMLPNDCTFKIYPNPASDFVILNIGKCANEECILNVYTVFGEKIMSQKIKDYSQKISLSHLKNGIYLFEIISSNSRRTQKIIIQH